MLGRGTVWQLLSGWDGGAERREQGLGASAVETEVPRNSAQAPGLSENGALPH